MHVLVTVGSRHGSTREIGAGIAQVLERAGHVVEQVDPDEVTSVAGFDAVVLGSAVYVGRLTESVRALALRLEGALAELPLWLFWSGPIGSPPRPDIEPDDVGYLARRLHPRDVRVFGGCLEPGALEMAERSQRAAADIAAGDFRDFAEIDLWADEIAGELRATLPHPAAFGPSSEWHGLRSAR